MGGGQSFFKVLEGGGRTFVQICANSHRFAQVSTKSQKLTQIPTNLPNVHIRSILVLLQFRKFAYTVKYYYNSVNSFIQLKLFSMLLYYNSIILFNLSYPAADSTISRISLVLGPSSLRELRTRKFPSLAVSSTNRCTLLNFSQKIQTA